MVTPLLRKSSDTGIFGNKSMGKTMTMTFIGLVYYFMDYLVFSNYTVKYPHIRIDSLTSFDLVRKYPQSKKKVILMEDFERWVNSRNVKEKKNYDINSICIDNGKNNASIVYTSKRPMAVDISLRDTVDVAIETEPILPVRCNTGNKVLDRYVNNLWSDDLEMIWIKIKAFDNNLDPIGDNPFYLTNPVFVGSLYNTQEILEEFKEE